MYIVVWPTDVQGALAVGIPAMTWIDDIDNAHARISLHTRDACRARSRARRGGAEVFLKR